MTTRIEYNVNAIHGGADIDINIDITGGFLTVIDKHEKPKKEILNYKLPHSASDVTLILEVE